MVHVSPQLSIIIPTHNRPRILQKCLDCIAAQTILCSETTDGKLSSSVPEVIVVSDGPDKKTAEMFQGLDWPFTIQYFAIPKSQQGVCRNRAVEKARGKYVLLIGDDIFLAPDACEAHLRAHERCDTKDVAVLGFTTWDPSLKITSLMKWMEKSGVQFGYDKITKYAQNFIPKNEQHWFTYTSNVSLSAKLFWKNRFREDVSLYGWEDIEWGKRLAESGASLYYEPNAKAYHHHLYTDAEVWERSKLLGESAVIMDRLMSAEAQSMRVTPSGWKKMAHWLCSFLPMNRGRHWRKFFNGIKRVNESRITS